MNLEQARFNMIEQQIRPWNVSSPEVLHLMSVVRREDFAPVAYKALAFVDMEIPLPGNEHMLAPRVQARLMQDAAVQRHEKVLEVGAGTGYMTALLAHRAQRVIALEINAELAKLARANLQKAGIHNAEVREKDAASTSVADGPFDVIVLGGSLADVPQGLLAQLKVGGRLVGVLGHEPVMRAHVITRIGENSFETQTPWDTVTDRLHHFSETSQFRF